MNTMEERTAVLRALAAGDLTVDEADERLAAMEAATEDAARPPGPDPWTLPVPPIPSTPPFPPVPPAPPRAGRRAGRSDGRRPGRPSVDDVIALAAHGVDADFLRGLRQAGYDHLTTDEVIALADHGVDLEALHAFRKAGLESLTAGEMIALVDHGVEPEDVRAFLDLRRPDHRRDPDDRDEA